MGDDCDDSEKKNPMIGKKKVRRILASLGAGTNQHALVSISGEELSLILFLVSPAFPLRPLPSLPTTTLP